MNYLMAKKLALSAGGWWVSSSCLAAYRFKGAASQSDAVHDMSGNGYDLTVNGSAPWSASRGFNLSGSSRYLTNTTLNNRTIRTIIIRYSDLDADNGQTSITMSHPNTSAGLLGRSHFRCFYNGSWTNYGSAGASFLSNTSGTSPLTYRESSSTTPTSGILGASSSVLYLNGSSWGSNGRSRGHDDGISNVGGWSSGSITVGGTETGSGFYAITAAFYSTVLTAAEHALIAANMSKF